MRAEPHQEILARTAATNDPRTMSSGFSDDLPYEGKIEATGCKIILTSVSEMKLFL
jgi:hypothetical protein